MTLGFRFARHLLSPALAYAGRRDAGPYRRRVPPGWRLYPGVYLYWSAPGVPIRGDRGAKTGCFMVRAVGFEGPLCVVHLA